MSAVILYFPITLKVAVFFHGIGAAYAYNSNTYGMTFT